MNLALLQKDYTKGIALTNSRVSDINQQTLANIINSLNVDWTSYTISTYLDSTQVIEFSMPDDTLLLSPKIPAIGDSVHCYTKTSAVFILRADTVNTSFFMKTVEDATAPGYQSVINYMQYQKIPTGFTGNVLYFTLNRDFLNGWQWQNGNLAATFTLGNIIAPISNNSSHLQTDEAAAAQCIETTYTVYSEQYDGHGNVLNTIDLYSFSTITCTGGAGSASSPATPISGGGGGANGAPSVPVQNPCKPNPVTVQSIKGRVVDQIAPGTGTGSGSGSGSTSPCVTKTNPTNLTPAVQTIKDNVTNPCLKALIDNLTTNQTIQTDVTNILRNTFGVNDQVNLTFLQSTLTDDPTATAETDGPQKDNFEITFNTPQITNASQEYLLETTMHEIFHAYLYQNPTVRGNLTSHTYMIQNYVNTEVQTMQQVFPNLSTHDAECLVLGGYGSLDSATLNAAISSYSLSPADVQSTNSSYKAGTSGTNCK